MKKLKFLLGEGLKAKPLLTALIELERYEWGLSICPVYLTNLYIQQTKSIRTGDSLMVSQGKPFSPAHVDTVRRCLVSVTSIAGVDTSGYKAQST